MHSLPLPVLYLISCYSAGASSHAPDGWAAARVAVPTPQASLKWMMKQASLALAYPQA